MNCEEDREARGKKITRKEVSQIEFGRIFPIHHYVILCNSLPVSQLHMRGQIHHGQVVSLKDPTYKIFSHKSLFHPQMTPKTLLFYFFI